MNNKGTARFKPSQLPHFSYQTHTFCGKCRRWWKRRQLEALVCPRCGNPLRLSPKKNKCRVRSRVKPPIDAEVLFRRLFERGWSVEDALEAVEALTGEKPTVEVAAT